MAKKNLNRGIFITFEGPEGCGKSTHARALYKFLRSRLYKCVLTREPGGTRCGEEVRRILLHSDGVEISDMAELFLFEAARAEIVEEVIRPALAKGNIVICDRFGDATVSYQGYAGGIDIAAIESVNKIATGGLEPDITVLLDIDTMTGLKRAKAKGVDRMERKAFAYHDRVRRGYLKLAKRHPRRIKIIKVKKTIADTQKLVRSEVGRVIQGYKRSG
ncbi:MAG: dTMP kinase [Candidatus Omnitrophota bacterium]